MHMTVTGMGRRYSDLYFLCKDENIPFKSGAKLDGVNEIT